jgi:hypothetical protein
MQLWRPAHGQENHGEGAQECQAKAERAAAEWTGFTPGHTV